MIKKVLYSFFGLISAVILIAGISNMDILVLGEYLQTGSYIESGTYTKATTYVQTGTEVRAPEFVLGSGASVDSLGRIVMYVRNKSGDTLVSGRLVAWDTTEVEISEIPVMPNIAWTDTGEVLIDEGGPYGIRVDGDGTPTQDSVYIYGTAITDVNTATATTEVINLALQANDIRYSSYLWDEIDSIKVDSGAAAGVDSLTLFLSPFRGVALATATSINLAGVTLESIADNAVGQIAVYGEVLARCKTASGTYVRNGWPLLAAESGTVLPMLTNNMVSDSIIADAGTIVGYGLGTKDDVSDSANIWIFLDTR